MDAATLHQSASGAEPPDGLSLPLQALWWDAHGSWDKAHACAQADEGRDGSAVHAYLHRKEPDLANAGYWYNRAGRSMPQVSLEAEWMALASELLRAAGGKIEDAERP